jgi:hypothetical protein
MAIAPATRLSTWSPGVQGGIPADSDVTRPATVWLPDGDPYGGYSIDPALGNDTTNAATAINAAIQSAGAVATENSRRIVLLPTGTFRVNSGLTFDQSYVTVRGQGAAFTKIKLYATEEQVFSNGYLDYPASAVNVSENLAATSFLVPMASVASFAVGDIIQIDQLDDTSYVFIYDAWYHKRAPGWSDNGPTSSGGYRSVTSMHRVSEINGTTLTIDPPTRIAYDTAHTAQAWKVLRDGDTNNLRWAGIERLYVTGGGNNAISIRGAVNCWLYGIESDGTTTTGRGMVGDHIGLMHCFRCTIDHCYVHHATNIVQGGGAYGITLNLSTSECLVVDCIAVFLNKAVQTNTSGGGNVFAYNYVDNIRTGLDYWMEGACNGSHQAFSHHDLWEGNWGANIGCDATHGSSGWLFYFRNHAAGQCSDATYRSLQNANMRAANGDAWMREMTFVGNVLHANALGANQPVYEITNQDDYDADGDSEPVWRFGDNEMRGGGGVFDSEYTTGQNETDPNAYTPPNPTYTDKAIAMLWRHRNYDNVTASIADTQGGYDTSLPNSLYLSSKPAFFGSLTWPWVNSGGATRLYDLPAKLRYDNGTPNAFIEDQVMATTLSTAARNAACNGVVDLLDGGDIQIRDASNNVLATVDFSATAFGAANTGVATAADLPLAFTGTGDGTATNFLARNSTGDTILSGTVTATGDGGDITLDNTVIATDQGGSITACTYTQPASPA